MSRVFCVFYLGSRPPGRVDSDCCVPSRAVIEYCRYNIRGNDPFGNTSGRSCFKEIERQTETMVPIYNSKAAERIIQKYAGDISEISACCGLPAPFLQAILFQEITQIDLIDLLVDGVVRLNWRTYTLRERVTGGNGPDKAMNRGRSLRRKLDSSTGYAQIFAFVAINAVNFAVERGLITYEDLGIQADYTLDPDLPADCRYMWNRLNRDRVFNLKAAALNLIAAAEEVTGRIEFGGYSAEEVKRIFTRYNGTMKQISPYGEEAYRHYLRYAGRGEEVLRDLDRNNR